MKKVILIWVFMFLISLCYVYVVSGLSLGYIDKDIRNDLLTNVNEVKTTEIIVQQSPSGGGGGGSSPSVTNIYNTYIIQPEEDKEGEIKEEQAKEDLADVTVAALSGITGATIAEVSKASPLVGMVIIIIVITSSGLLIYFFVSFKKK